MGFREQELDDAMNEVKDSVKNSDEAAIDDGYENITSDRLISSGSALMNLALSDTINGGFILGSMVNVIGESDTGKSLQGMAVFAEAVRDKRFDKYDLRYGNIEEGIHFPMERMFGDKMDRVDFFPKDRKKAYTMQKWHEDLLKWSFKPMLHVTDSFDGLTTETILDKAAKGESGKAYPEKALISTAAWPTVIGQIKHSNSLLIVISQSKNKINTLFPEKTRAGGVALKFFATCEVWLKKGGPIFKTVRGHKVKKGEWTVCDVSRTRITGKKRTVRFPVYYEYGIDDIEAMIEWMVDWKFWDREKKKKSDVDEGEDTGKVIDTNGDFINGKVETLVRHIEENNLEEELKAIVQESWNQVEEELTIQRKPKY